INKLRPTYDTTHLYEKIRDLAEQNNIYTNSRNMVDLSNINRKFIKQTVEILNSNDYEFRDSNKDRARFGYDMKSFEGGWHPEDLFLNNPTNKQYHQSVEVAFKTVNYEYQDPDPYTVGNNYSNKAMNNYEMFHAKHIPSQRIN